MNKIYFIFLLGTSLVQGHSVETIHAHLQKMQTLKARITQTTEKGTATGMLYVQRPGQLKIFFGPPQPFSLIVNGDVCVYEDALTERPFHIPLDRIPLGFLLNKDVDLRQNFNVQNLRPDGSDLWVDVETKDGMFKISLLFSNTYDLKGWIMNDTDGQKVIVTLSNVQKNAPLDQKVFKHHKKGTRIRKA